MVIHLNFNMKKEKDDRRNRHRKNKAEEEKKANTEEEEETNQINFHPKLDKCDEFLKSALTMMV